MKSTMIDVTGADRTGVPCVGCGAPTAMICDGCTQASALHWWAGPERCPEPADVSSGWCRLCHAGGATWCALCWPVAVVAARAELGRPAVTRPCAKCGGEGSFTEERAVHRRLCGGCAGSGRVPAWRPRGRRGLPV